MHDGPNSLAWDVRLLSYWLSRNPSDVLPRLARKFDQQSQGGHCFDSSRTRRITGGKITTFKLGHSVFFMVAYDCACSLNVSIRMAWISFRALPCRKKKLDDSSHLDFVEIMHVTWHFPFSLCNKKGLAVWHMNRQTPFPMTLSIPSYNIGK
jgi:hypothetical protein